MNNDHTSSMHIEHDYPNQLAHNHNNNNNFLLSAPHYGDLAHINHNNLSHSNVGSSSGISSSTGTILSNNPSSYSSINPNFNTLNSNLLMNTNLGNPLPTSTNPHSLVDTNDLLPPSHRNSFSFGPEINFFMPPSTMNILPTDTNHHHSYHGNSSGSILSGNAHNFLPPSSIPFSTSTVGSSSSLPPPHDSTAMNLHPHPNLGSNPIDPMGHSDHLLFPLDNNYNTNSNVRRGSRTRKPNTSRIDNNFLDDFESPLINSTNNDEGNNTKSGGSGGNNRRTSSTTTTNNTPSNPRSTPPNVPGSLPKNSSKTNLNSSVIQPNTIPNTIIPFQLTTLTSSTNKELLSTFQPTAIPTPTKQDILINDDLDVPVAILPEPVILAQQELLLPPPLPPGALQHTPYSDTVKVSERLRTEGLPHDAFRRAKLMADVCRRSALLATEVTKTLQNTAPVLPSVSSIVDMNLRKQQLITNRKRARPNDPTPLPDESSINIFDSSTFNETNAPSLLSNDTNNLTTIPNFATIWKMSNEKFSQSYIKSPEYPSSSVAHHAHNIALTSENTTSDPAKDPNWLMNALHLRADVADAFLRAVLRDVAAEEEAEAERRRLAEDRIRREKERAELRKKRAAGAREGRAKAKAKAAAAAAALTTNNDTVISTTATNEAGETITNNTENNTTNEMPPIKSENITNNGNEMNIVHSTNSVNTTTHESNVPPSIVTSSLITTDDDINLFTNLSAASSTTNHEQQQHDDRTYKKIKLENKDMTVSPNTMIPDTTFPISTPLITSSSSVPTSPMMLTGAAAREAAALARKEERLRDRAILNKLLLQNSSMSLSNPGPLLRSAMIYARCKATVTAAESLGNTNTTINDKNNTTTNSNGEKNTDATTTTTGGTTTTTGTATTAHSSNTTTTSTSNGNKHRWNGLLSPADGWIVSV